MIKRFFQFLMLSAGLFHGPLVAQDRPQDIPVEAFAKIPEGAGMEMSPNGERLAYIMPVEGRKNILVYSFSGEAPYLLPPIKDADIAWFTWANDDILLLSYRYTEKDMGSTYHVTRLVTYSVSAHKMKVLVQPKRNSRISYQSLGNIGDNIVDMLKSDPEHILLALDDDFDGDVTIYKVNVSTGKRKRHYRPRTLVSYWMVDEQAEARWAKGYKFNKPFTRYRNPVTNKWQTMDDVAWYKKEHVQPLRFMDDPRYAYVARANDKGLMGIVKFDLVEGKVVEDVFFHDTVDVSGLVTVPDTGAIIGVSYTEDTSKIHFLRDDFKRAYNKIQAALGNGVVTILSLNREKKAYLIKYSNSNMPAEYYYLNGSTGELLFLLSANKKLPPELMSTVTPISYSARDGLTIHGYLTIPKDSDGKNLPTIIFPHGGPNTRDTLSFDPWVQFFASRGYAVLQPNFRGSSGYGNRFQALGKKQWGGTMQDDVTDGTNWLIDEGVADPANICIVGISYGGYAALMGAVKEPDLYECAASINGVSDLPRQITHERQFVGGRNWVKSIGLTGEKVKTVSPVHQADKIKIPVLIVHSKDDPIVPRSQGKAIAKKLKKQATYLQIENGDHYLDTEDAKLLTFKALEKFLKKHLDE